MSTIASRWIDYGVMVWAIIISALVFGLMHNYAFDDPFITYRYAANLANDQGLVYNPGLQVLSTTALLYALFLSPFAALGLPLPLVGVLLGSLGLGTCAVALWYLAKLSHAPVAGAMLSLLLPLSPLLLATLGAETVLVIALVLWGLLLAWQGRVGLAGLLIGLATLTRPDAILAVAVIGLLLLTRYGLDPTLRFAVVVMLVITPVILATWWYFGAPLPTTLQTKQSQAYMADSQSFLEGLGRYLVSLGRSPGFWPLLVLAPLGLSTALTRPGPLNLVLLWSLLHVLAYTLLGVTAYFWYFAPAITGLVVAAALGAQWLVERLRVLLGRRATAGLIAVGTTMVLFTHLQSVSVLAQADDLRLQIYRPAGQWLAANTSPDAQVGALEVGIIGFYAERPMVDFAGLIQPDVAAVFRAGGDYYDAARYALARYQPAYVVNQETLFPLLSADPTLATACHEVASFPDPRAATPLQIFQCIWE
ncbi:MAG: hypothetical protein AB4911_04345 [Oscillochloridaceae bacterium umkhey_bin13]